MNPAVTVAGNGFEAKLNVNGSVILCDTNPAPDTDTAQDPVATNSSKPNPKLDNQGI